MFCLRNYYAVYHYFVCDIVGRVPIVFLSNSWPSTNIKPVSKNVGRGLMIYLRNSRPCIRILFSEQQTVYQYSVCVIVDRVPMFCLRNSRPRTNILVCDIVGRVPMVCLANSRPSTNIKPVSKKVGRGLMIYFRNSRPCIRILFLEQQTVYQYSVCVVVD